ncbi:DUF4148 domain-containing protein [Trinickia caryophylli]|uniref:DUF4148 domain-containing protein n=1 Tax=Trinickia caryophylli TaxID=28094 RepID=A0A1X7GJN8_TRICW|nr:DUF4148 domain-containing protein [Trinickia caryophylli]PMS09913.1 DUF4148 domain-containing protein [Trinickia caryophylli]TRX14950.1 DUF4148 domain-containing protein [Trinickia caryophylli]WQE14806.1 DUF4148 domain-containing protein [Trinickia caryophylli]SMF70701.1 protein of unknown function [Trinickia caryophylli]GLU35007.1 hypothetical protein Busp01_48490 [Trinickia caryophylli]
MKTLACLAIAIGTLASPVLTFAQSNAPVTRAEVRADLVRIEQAGYNPAIGSDPHYPDDIQAAEAKVAAEQHPVTSDVGGSPANGASGSGMHVHTATRAPSACVGPVSFCDVYFGS